MLNKKNAVSLLLITAVIFTPLAQAFADFNPSKLIDDKTFSDTQTFGSAAGIQQFLTSKNSPLADTSADFLQKLKEPTDSIIKTGLGDPEPNLGRLRTAAELIWDASVQTGINPQVILVTLQKEQTLITGSFSASRLQSALDHALGFGCPSTGCDQNLVGFYHQLFGGFDAQGNKYVGSPGSLMRSFNTSGGRGPYVDAQGQVFGPGPLIRISHVNDVIVLDNTLGGPQNPQPTQAVTLSNNATAALYRYTPHVYNGNYNFWKFFDQWFRYPNGTLLKLASDNVTYIVNNGLKSVIPNFVIQSRALNVASIITVSPTELSSIDPGPIVGPADNVIVKVDTDPTKLFVFENNLKHPVSSFVLSQRGLNSKSALTISQSEADMFSTSSLLTPKEGTLIKATGSGAVYVIANQKKMALSAFTFKQNNYAIKNIVTLPADELAQYADGGFLLPKNGTLVKTAASPAVYQIDNSLLHPISSVVFKLHNFNLKSVVTLSDGELANASMSVYVTPPEKTFFKTPDGLVYYFVGGTKHTVSAFVLKQRKVSPINLTADEAFVINDGAPLTPKDGTLIKGDNSGTIYVIKSGLKVALDFNTWSKTYKKAKPTVLPQAEVDSYLAPGDIEQ
ncbi:MAG: hypothetical protein JWO40_505 [Candidatus Doudnabacteria bacterium]|nr:hypothetical protein [Candidatus Doudnabacteria bacterium]